MLHCVPCESLLASSNMARKIKPTKRSKPPPIPVPIPSPKIWMANDFDPNTLPIPVLRAIIDFMQVTDPYYRRHEQIAVFNSKVLPRIKILVDRHHADISKVEDSVLLEQIRMISTINPRKRLASPSSEEGLTERDEDHKKFRPLPKRLRSSQ